jgi:Uri superfamily endonuclease
MHDLQLRRSKGWTACRLSMRTLDLPALTSSPCARRASAHGLERGAISHHRMTSLRPAPGTYLLLIDVTVGQTVMVGRLGTLRVRPGVYGYVGSAFGPGGVRARATRHHRGTTPPHWHIDYLRPAGRLRQVWHTYDEVRRECTWARALQSLPAATRPLSGFGASDCSCPVHLIWWPRAPSLAAFRERLVNQVGVHAPIRVTSAEDAW